MADHMLVSLSQGRGGFHLEAAHESRDRLLRAGVVAPEANVQGLTRTTSSPDSLAWGGSPLPRLKSKKCSLAFGPTHRALVRSQRGPMASIPFFTPPVSIASRFDPQSFRVLLLRRLWCQLPLCSATCRCGQPLDSRGHHRGACAHAGFLVAVGSRWKVAPHESAERQVPGCLSTSVSKIWTSIQGREQMTAVWKWSPTVCLCSTAHSLP